MKATHRGYKHPNCLRVEMEGDVFCMSPSDSRYAGLNKPSLPVYGDRPEDYDLPRHSSEDRK